MISFKIFRAKEKDIEIITSMKMLTMIDADLDTNLSPVEKQKLKDGIVRAIKKDYKSYNIIVSGDETIGTYSTIDYADGKIIDLLYLVEEFRNLTIGSRIVKQLISSCDNLYAWSYVDGRSVEFFRSLGFVTYSKRGSTLILKYQLLDERDLDCLKSIKIGYKDRAGNKYLKIDDLVKDRYYLQTPDELLQSKIGLCFDQVELARRIITKMKYNVDTYYLMYSNVSLDASHTFLVYNYCGKYVWFENAWLKYRGKHEYDTKEELLKDVIKKFIKTIPNGNIDNIRMFKYDKPRAGMGYGKTINHFISGEKIKVKDLFI